MIICIRCRNDKEFKDFSRDVTKYNNCQTYCKLCKKKDNIKANINSALYYKKNKDKIYAKSRQRAEEKRLLAGGLPRINGKIQPRPRKKLTPERIKKKKEYDRIYMINNAVKLRENKKIYKIHKLKTDPIYRFKKYVRCTIYQSFYRSNKGFAVKTGRTTELLGCSFEYFRSYIENKFTLGMNWDNAGKWHLDHIIPLSSATTNEEIIALCHYLNFQPLWAIDNYKKGAKLNYAA